MLKERQKRLAFEILLAILENDVISWENKEGLENVLSQDLPLFQCLLSIRKEQVNFIKTKHEDIFTNVYPREIKETKCPLYNKTAENLNLKYGFTVCTLSAESAKLHLGVNFLTFAVHYSLP